MDLEDKASCVEVCLESFTLNETVAKTLCQTLIFNKKTNFEKRDELIFFHHCSSLFLILINKWMEKNTVLSLFSKFLEQKKENE